MPNTLTLNQIATLETFKNKGDRFNYWNTLAGYGDSYAKLALDVVTNESFPGQIANGNLAAVARENGVLIDSQKSRDIGVRLMQEDFLLRRDTRKLNLPAESIETYHTAVFEEFRLPPTAWTAFEVLRQARLRGGSAEYNAVWNAWHQGQVSHLTSSQLTIDLHGTPPPYRIRRRRLSRHLAR